MSGHQDRRIVQKRVISEPLELRDNGEAALPAIVGHAAVFNRKTDLGWFSEEVAPGAFADSLSRGDDVRALFNHDPNFVLGRTKAETLFLAEDSIGLSVRILPPDTQVSRDLIEGIRRGDISQMSFGFQIEEEKVQAKGPGRDKTHFILTKVRLFDVSVVTFPAYTDTEADLERQMRNRMEPALRTAKAEYELRTRKLALLKNC